MLETSVRLLRLLSLLQARPDWAGADLAERLGVTIRTVRDAVRAATDTVASRGPTVDAETLTVTWSPS
jgi:transcriptional antiterminator